MIRKYKYVNNFKAVRYTCPEDVKDLRTLVEGHGIDVWVFNNGKDTQVALEDKLNRSFWTPNPITLRSGWWVVVDPTNNVGIGLVSDTASPFNDELNSLVTEITPL